MIKTIMSTLAISVLLTGCNLFDGSSSDDNEPPAGDFQTLLFKLFDVDNPLSAEPIDISELEISGTDFSQDRLDDFINRSGS